MVPVSACPRVWSIGPVPRHRTTLQVPPRSRRRSRCSPPGPAPRGTEAVRTAPVPGGRSAATGEHGPPGPRGSSASGGHPCRADAVLRWPTHTALTPGVWPPKNLGCYLQPMPLHRCLARPAAGMLYAKYYSGAAEDFALQRLPGADGSSRSEHYRRRVSRWHGLSSNANLAEELVFSASSCPCGKWLCHSLPGTREVGKGDASPGQGPGRRLGGGLAPRGLFLSRVKNSSAWGDELLGRGR